MRAPVHELTYDELTAKLDGGLTALEGDLLKKCRLERPLVLGTTVPDESTPQNTIRGPVIRYLMSGGCPHIRPGQKGVWIVGAWITDLDLDQVHSGLSLILQHCRLPDPTQMQLAKLGRVDFDGSSTSSLNALGLHTTGTFRCANINSNGAFDLGEAKIGGQLSFENATLNAGDGEALNGQGIDVAHGAFFREAKVTGSIDLNAGRIGGQLNFKKATLKAGDGKALNGQVIDIAQAASFDSATVTGSIHLNGGRIGGQLDFENATLNAGDGDALNGQDLSTGALFFRKLASVTGLVDLTRASTELLCDDMASWSKAQYRLDGFQYDTIIGAPLDAKQRLEWLANGVPSVERIERRHDLPPKRRRAFNPQPYRQLAKVLDDLGHRHDRAAVLYEMEKRQRSDIQKRVRIRQKVRGDGWREVLHADLSAIGDFFMRHGVGYGHRPYRVLTFTAFVTLPIVVLAHLTWTNGQFAPADPIALLSYQWEDAQRADNPAQTFSDSTGRDFESFQPLIYAADVFVPLVDFGQEDTWAPSKPRGAFAWWLFWLSPIVKLLGWIITALGAAAVTGIIQRER